MITAQNFNGMKSHLLSYCNKGQLVNLFDIEEAMQNFEYETEGVEMMVFSFFRERCFSCMTKEQARKSIHFCNMININ